MGLDRVRDTFRDLFSETNPVFDRTPGLLPDHSWIGLIAEEEDALAIHGVLSQAPVVVKQDFCSYDQVADLLGSLLPESGRVIFEKYRGLGLDIVVHSHLDANYEYKQEGDTPDKDAISPPSRTGIWTPSSITISMAQINGFPKVIMAGTTCL